DEWDYTMNTSFNNGKSYTAYSPTGTYSYKIKTPMRWSVGAAYTFWNRGLVSVDYESVDYSGIRISETRGGAGNFSAENSYIGQSFGNAHILRVGAEIRASELISIRGGYQSYSPAVKGAASRKAYSAGLGFNISPTFSIDLAWSRLAGTTDNFQLYDDYSSAVTVPTGTDWHSKTKAVCTLAIKF
ncbi:MAG: hypothetical protein IJ636_06945, partial [Bacteroidales bacterium]|nr:hypothetical protein [Bacteroidales bacterium]